MVDIADLTNAAFTGANLQNAVFSNAKLDGAVFTRQARRCDAYVNRTWS
jgi:uncharacterized protein YjbI with pentapeptide repeats